MSEEPEPEKREETESPLPVRETTELLDKLVGLLADGDYKEAVRYLRRDVGKDVQIVSWRVALSKELEKIANKPTIFLDDYWREICEIREKPPLEEIPAADEEGIGEGGGGGGGGGGKRPHKYYGPSLPEPPEPEPDDLLGPGDSGDDLMGPEVPEPATAAFLTLGGLLALSQRRRKIS